MLAYTGILPKRKKTCRLFPLKFLQFNLFLLLLSLLTACTTNIDNLGTIEKNTPQSAENNGTQTEESASPASKGQNSAPQSNQQNLSHLPSAMANNGKIKNQPETVVQSQNFETQQQGKMAHEEIETSKKTALFPFGRKKVSSEQTDLTTEQAPAAPQQTDINAQPLAANNDRGQQKTKNIAPTSPQNSTDLELNNQSATPQQIPDRDSASQKKGSLMRLFGHSDSQSRNSLNGNEKKTALVPLPKQDSHEYKDALPGVRPNGGIVIKHRTSLYDDTDIDANEIDSPSLYTLASVSVYGRSLPNGLKIARKDIEVSCLKPQLVALLKIIERRFNKPVIITSGYRSPSYNQKVNGANRSMHMSCAAADIQVPETNKWEVANFVRSLPNRGGVGTYCHQSIHVDVGPKRDWNWSCSAKN